MMVLRSSHNIIQLIGNVLTALLIFVIMLDPTNTVTHMKDKIFIVLFAFNCVFFRPSLRYLPQVASVFAVLLIAYILAAMRQIPIDEEFFFGQMKAFAPLTLLLWVHHYDYIRLSVIPAFIVSVISVAIYIAVNSSELVEIAVWEFVKAHGDMIMMSRRSFLGIPVFAMYYKSIMCFGFALFTMTYKVFTTDRKRLLYIIGATVVSAAFLFSGTRGSLIFLFVEVLTVLYLVFGRSRKIKYLMIPVIFTMAMMLMLLIFMLATEQGEASNNIKFAHVESYLRLFADHPSYLLFGQCPGSAFYSAGFNRFVLQTEWTYMELLRCYGIFSLVIIWVVCYPLRNLIRHSHDNFILGITVLYVCYLLVAGTNPLLVSSTGIAVILSIYSQSSLLTNLENDENIIEKDILRTT